MKSKRISIVITINLLVILTLLLAGCAKEIPPTFQINSVNSEYDQVHLEHDHIKTLLNKNIQMNEEIKARVNTLEALAK